VVACRNDVPTNIYKRMENTMRNPTLRNSLLAITLIMLTAGCTAKCNCPTCPVAQQQPQTTIIHEPE
jgi:hypothetical protein